MRNIPYHLYAVFMHHGSVSFGHYYIYIYDFAKNIWRKYNDNYVTEVHNTAEIFGGQQDQRNPPTPYFVVYVHDRMRERVAQPVCRTVAEETDQQHQHPPRQSSAKPTAPPTPPPQPSAPHMPAAGEEVEMAEVSRGGCGPGHESRKSSPGMHNHNHSHNQDVAGSNRAVAARTPSSSGGGADWNVGVADRRDVPW